MAAKYPTSDPSFTTKTDGADQIIYASYINDLQDEVVAMGAALRGTLAHDVKVGASKQFTELNRSVHVGDWTDVAFNAGNFTAKGSLTWTVEEADAATFRYRLIGNSMDVQFYIATTSTGGTADDELWITVPASATVASNCIEPILANDAGSLAVGYAKAINGETKIRLFKAAGGGNWSNAATNTTGVFGKISLKVTGV